ncbi:MAG: hydrolase [Candidatus Paralactobacillus gallistercoris]|uniref:Hydrolase n=1 Tax=Candidatus Paralactobacillus gallistercoris TaxID=2838724 RepID=A0A948TIV8_9LACO|nr:hydrolase [Candidatus Paralactobacillus gallistercoris]
MTQKIEQWRNDPEYVALIADLLQKDAVKRLAAFPQHYYSNRLKHSISVSYYSYLIGKKFHLNTRALARAGLLHDLFYYDWRNTHLTLSKHNQLHPLLALHNAERITKLTPMEKDIIVKHMWGATTSLPKYRESFVVSLVDDYCAVDEVVVPLMHRLERKLRFIG